MPRGYTVVHDKSPLLVSGQLDLTSPRKRATPLLRSNSGAAAVTSFSYELQRYRRLRDKMTLRPPSSVPALLGRHYDAWARYVAAVRTWSPWMLGFLVITLGLMSLAILIGEIRAYDSVNGLFESPEAAVTYGRLRSWVAFVEWMVGAATLVLALGWGWLSWGVYLLINLMVDILIEPLNPEGRSSARRTRLYSRVIEKTVGRRLRLLGYGLLLIVAAVYIGIDITSMNLDQVVGIFVLTVIVLVPFPFVITWVQFLRIRATRRRTMLTAWDDYLFSRRAMFNTLKGVAGFAIMLAAIGWILLPGLLVAVLKVEEVGVRIVTANTEYSDNWSDLIAVTSRQVV